MEINAQKIMETLTLTHEITLALTSFVSERVEAENYAMMMSDDFGADYVHEEFRIPVVPLDGEDHEQSGPVTDVVISFEEVAERIQNGSNRGGQTLQ